MAIEPIKGFYVHDEETNTDGVAKVSIEAVQEFEDDIRDETDKWLDEHPEATTTVQDNAVTTQKIADGAVMESKISDGAVTDAKANASATFLNKSSYIETVSLANTTVGGTTAAYVTVPSDVSVYVGDAGNYTTTPLKYAGANATTVTSIIGITLHTTSDETIFPTIISNGEVVYEHRVTETLVTDDQQAVYFAVPYDRSRVDEFPISSTTATLLNGNYEFVSSAFFPLIRNGVNVDLSGFTSPHIIARKTPRNAIGLKENGDIILFAADGYNAVTGGLTGVELQTVMQSLGCKWAYCLDGGGSTSLVFKGSRVIRFIENSGTSERNYRWTLNAKAEKINPVLTAAYADVGTVQEMIFRSLMPLINYALNEIQNPVDITSTAITMNTNYSLTTGKIWKQGRHVFGDIVVKKTSGNFSNSTETVAALSLTPSDAVNTGCFFSDSQWYNKSIGYLYYSQYGLSVKPEEHDVYNYVKITLDYVTQ